MKLINLYKDILALGGMYADKDGFVSGKMPGMEKGAPVTIKGKRLVLPTKHQLSTSDWSDRIVFHPLYENVLRGESQVIEKLRNLIANRINMTIGVLGIALLRIAENTEDHSKLNPDQTMFLAKVKMLDDKTRKNFEDMLKDVDAADSKNNFVHVYLKRSGIVDGKKHARVGVVTFPIYQMLASGDPVFGKKPRVKDREVFKHLIEYIFKDVHVEGAYNAGSDSAVAPYTDALLRTFLNVIAPLNDTIDLFKNVAGDLEDLKFGYDWIEELDKLDSYKLDIRSIPMQAGNEGASLVRGVAPQEEQQENVPSAQTTQTDEAGRTPIANWQPPPQQPFPQPQPQQQYGWMGQQHPQQQYGQQQQPQVVHTREGADFGSILASNPALAMSAMMFTQQPQQIGMQQQPIPRFAQQVMGTGFGTGQPMYPQQQFFNFGQGQVGVGGSLI